MVTCCIATSTPVGIHDAILPNTPILWDGVQCHGNETSLFDCPRNDVHDSLNWEDTVLHCRGIIQL